MAYLLKFFCTVFALTFGVFADLNFTDLDDITPITPRDLTSETRDENNDSDDFYQQLNNKEKTASPKTNQDRDSNFKKLNSLPSLENNKSNLTPIKEISENKTETIIEDPEKEAEISSKAQKYAHEITTEPNFAETDDDKVDTSHDSAFMSDVAGKATTPSSQNSKLGKESKKTPVNRNSSNSSNSTEGKGSSWAFYIFAIITLLSIIFLLFWYQTQMKKKFSHSGIPIEVLGQTFIDGGTKIMLLKVGAKVLVLAKSNQFCTTIDTITDPNEVNMLTLGSGAQATGEDFSQVLNQMAVPDMTQAQDIPNEKEIREELSELKNRLGNLK